MLLANLMKILGPCILVGSNEKPFGEEFLILHPKHLIGVDMNFLKILLSVVFVRIPFIGICLILMRIGRRAEKVAEFVDSHFPGFPNKY